MLSKFRSSAPLPVALLALFFAVGGVSAVADVTSSAVKKITGKNVRDSSLTHKDVRNNSLTGDDVRDGSLLAKDFRAGQLPGSSLPGPQDSKGETGQTGVTGQTGQTGAPGTPATRLFGEFDAEGASNPAVVHHVGVVSAERLSSGLYRIKFNRPVHDCVATAGINQELAVTVAGEASVGDSLSGTDSKVVSTFNSAGAAVDSKDFSVVVLCP